jgi:hypothetical protein
MTIQIPIISTYSDKGAKKAKSSLEELSGVAKKLGGYLGLAFSVNAVKNYAVQSVKAYAADEKAAKELARTLAQVGESRNASMTEDYIQSLQKATGILDDELRPALGSLVRVTQDSVKAQELLALALDISAGTGKDLGSVSMALAKAYGGNTTALSRLGAGLTAAELASKDFETIQKKLAYTFKGASSQAAETFEGQLKRLNAAAADAKETIGKGLVDALKTANGSEGIKPLIDSISSSAEDVANFARGIGIIADKLNVRVGDESVGGLLRDMLSKPLMSLPVVGAYAQAIADLGKKQADMQNKTNASVRKTAIWGQYMADKAAKAELARQKKLADAQKKAEREKALLKKANTLMDLDQIQIVAALQGKITEDEKLRLQLQMALLQDNATEADRLSNKLALSQLATTGLAMAIANLPPALNPLRDYPSYVNKAIDDIQLIQDALNKLKAPKLTVVVDTVYTGGGAKTGGGYTPSAPEVFAGMPTGGDQGAAQRALEYASMAKASLNTQMPDWASYRAGERSTNINVTVQGNVISNRDLTDSIRMGLLDSSASGSVSNSLRALGGG